MYPATFAYLAKSVIIPVPLRTILPADLEFVQISCRQKNRLD